ncbi:3'3'-cGAMP-specific phosphodiesterase 2 [Candidatus Magnetaquicoccaceae bacterium FCR-1]|uniref:3'3'-cGAMP-specific phosphodiesterase 2 n=1 Tax=Candidatus Magnetaquiglobus chichijimensis TaxID=3141448 RepID=A0ABQ0C4L0_9PROT
MPAEKRILHLSAKSPAATTDPGALPPWLVLVVDDDADVIAVTRLNLRQFQFAGRRLSLVAASSAQEARTLLEDTPGGFALALIDVVMESDDAGLLLVRHIRETLGDRKIRLIIRTGQPGLAPERYVIDHFDIDDYKEKSELSAQKLYTTVRSALKSYRDLTTIDMARQGLEAILGAAPRMYLHPLDSFEEFYSGVFTQILGLCHLGAHSEVRIANGFLALFNKDDITIKAAVGDVRLDSSPATLRENFTPTETVIPLRIRDETIGMLYLEHGQPLDPLALHLLRIFTGQVCVALQSLRMQMELRQAHRSAIQMLSEAAEAKDANTGEHIQRIVALTRRLSLALGLSPDLAEQYAQASQLHDIGKIGIPDQILNKPGPLDRDEFSRIATHSAIGGTIIKDGKNFGIAREIALYHHEKWDGSGYPEGLRGEAIPLSARIVSVVDVFDALTHCRPYKGPWSVAEAVAEIRRLSGASFDPRVVEAFERLHAGDQLGDLLQ